MGMFDSVYAPCPRCGEEEEFQSKSGRCCLYDYTLKNVPADVILGTEGKVRQCKKCETIFEIKFKTKVKAWTVVCGNEEDEEDDWH